MAALAVDRQGNVVIVDNLPSGGSRIGTASGDVIVSKIAATGSSIIYSVRLAGRGLEEGTGVAIDHTGAAVVTGHTNSPDFPLLNALQPTGQTIFVTGSRDKSAFVTKLDAAGRMVFSTGGGGSGEDVGAAIAVDEALGIYVIGSTASRDFETTEGTLQRTLARTACDVVAPCTDAFVSKLSPDGQTVMYSTLFGGTDSETVRAAAVDQSGSVHLAGITGSSDLPLRNAMQTTCDSFVRVNGCSGFVAKLNPTGSGLEYSTFFGSPAYYVFGLGQTVNGLAIDPEGNLLAVGTTQGNDLPLVRELQSINGSGPLFKSTDDGNTWSASGSGLSGTGVNGLASAGRRSPLYASTFGQFFMSSDQGRTWRGRRPSDANINPSGDFAIDPIAPTTIYAANSSKGVLKSSDAGATWTRMPLDVETVYGVALAPSSPSNVYVSVPARGVFHSPNGGLTWSLALERSPVSHAYPAEIAVDPKDAQDVYVAFSDGTMLRGSAGQQWNPVAPLPCPTNQLLFAPDVTRTIYARACGKVFKSVDRASSWTELNVASGYAAALALDESMPNALYLAASLRGLYRSKDRGQTWVSISEGFDQDFRVILVDPATPGTLYAGATSASNAFVARFDTMGRLTFSTYLGRIYASGSGVAADPRASIVVAGVAGRNFPLTRPGQSTYGGAMDAFIARIAVRP